MRERIVSSIIVALAGLFYIFAPHEFHLSAGVDFGLSHGMHVVLGIVLIGISIYYLRTRPIGKEIKKTRRKVRRKSRRSVSRSRARKRAQKRRRRPRRRR